MYCYMISTPGTIISVLVIIEKLCRQGKLAGTRIYHLGWPPPFECSNDAVLPQSTCTI